MKTMRGMWLAAIVIAVMACQSAALYASDTQSGTQDQSKREGHFKKMVEDLGLTPEQKAALEKDRNELMAKVKELREKIRAARTSLKAELDKAVTDVAKVNSLVSDLKEMIGQQIQYRIDKVMGMKKILTPEQFAKMKAKMEDRKKEFKGKHGKWAGHEEKGEAPEGAEGHEGI